MYPLRVLGAFWSTIGAGLDTREIEGRIERHVGRRIRDRRILLGLTQQRLAGLIGVTYQQAHKYECGINRVSAARLYKLARALGVDVGYFFEGFSADRACAALPERQRLCLDVARNFSRIRDERSRDALAQLCRVIADGARDP